MEKAVLAPIPGLVARVIVNEGDEVQEGDVVAVLNAMKMDIDIVSEENGKVKKLLVKEQDNVDIDTPMMILEVET